MDFLEDYDLDVVRAALLESLDRIEEAAELHLTEGRTMEAIRLFLTVKDNETCMRRANECILGCLWRHLSFGVSLDSAKSDTTLIQLLEWAAQLNAELLSPKGRDEVSISRILAANVFAHTRTPDIYVPGYNIREFDPSCSAEPVVFD